MPRDPMCAMERLPLVMPPWWAFWRKPEESWQVRTEAGTLGPMTHENALDVLDMVVDGQYGLGRLAQSDPSSCPPPHCYFLACDGNYLPFAALAAKRASELRATSIKGYILYAGAKDDRFEAVSRLLPHDVEIVDASKFLDGLSLNFSARITKATYLRIFADLVPQFAPYERVAYFDCDVLFNRDPGELLSSAMRAPLLAAHDLPSYYDLDYRQRLPLGPGAPYFNAGVLVFDMPAVRSAGLLERAREFATHNMDLCIQHDQDAMNVAFEGNWQTLHPLWNAMTNLHWMPAFRETYARHFSSKKPWSRNPIGVEGEAMAVYRRLAAGTEWAELFQASSIATSLSLAIKGIERKARTALAHFGGDQRRLRRARLEERLPSITERLAEHADAGVAGLQFPEREFGLV